jgi:predicted SAM-dependent methyltransferase
MPAPFPEKLHLGCGLTTPTGWLNVDGSWQVILARRPVLKGVLVKLGILTSSQAAIPWSPHVMRLNLTRPLPFESEYFQAVYSSHTLEHLYHEDALHLLKECHRVLKPGGICRAVVPDLESMVDRYRQAKAANNADAGTKLMEELLVHDKQLKRGWIGLAYRLTAFHQHKWMYDASSLQRLFETAGFKKVRRADYHDSGIAGIAEVEDPSRILDGQGVAVEGVKE